MHLPYGMRLKQIPFLKRRVLAHLLIISWVTVWLTVFPLIHVHPEADHAHGDTHHQHGGFAHSVLSQDLPCEFAHASSKETRLVGLAGASHSHSHDLNHSEITFSALNHFSDGPLKKPLSESHVTLHQAPLLRYCGAGWLVFTHQKNFSPHHLISPYFSRPPPVLII